jgi:anaerobic selenocysteine-containing dehydrogenase
VPGSRTATFTCNLCEALCGLRVTLAGDAERVTAIRGNPDDVLSRGHICPKGAALGELHHDPDRLRVPLVRDASGTLAPASWDDALDLCARRLGEVRRRHGPDAIALYVGNPTVHSHRAALGSQLLAAALGTRHRFDPNSQDSNPRLFAVMQVYGDALALPVPDLDRTRYLLVLGANPAASNGSQLAAGDVKARLRALRARGGQVVLVDPRRTESASLATRHLFIRPGGDAALLLALLHVLFAEGLVDRARVSKQASGLDALEAVAARFSPERVAAATGIAPDVMRKLARELADASADGGAVVYGRVGLCQNAFGPLASWLIEAVNIVTGNLDRAGGVMFPTPAADIAPLGRRLIGNHHGRWRSRLRGLPELLGALPSAVMAEEMETPGPGQIRALVVLAGNPVLSIPNGPRLERALPGLDFHAAVDLYVNETNRHADVILPAAHVFETGNYDVVLLRFVVRNLAKYSPPILARSAGGRDDWELHGELALRLLLERLPLPGRHLRSRLGTRLGALFRRHASGLPERIIDGLLRAGPFSLDLRRLAAAPDGVDLGPLVPGRLREHVRTADGRARLHPPALVADLPRLSAWVDAAVASASVNAPLQLIGRRHLRSNNSWMHNLPSLVKGPSRSQLLMHPDDARARGLQSGAAVRVQGRPGSVTAVLEISTEMMPGVVSLPHGFGHAQLCGTTRVAAATAGPSVNALTDEQVVEPLLGTSILNGVPVTVSPA